VSVGGRSSLPREAPPSPSVGPLPERGQARRFALEGAAELWRLADEARARRLWSLAQRGVGGFVAAGVDDQGPWLVRSLPPRLADLRKADSGAWPWRRAIGVALGIARALAACEEASLFGGALTPRTAAVSFASADEAPAQICLAAEALIGALVGEPGSGRDAETRAGDLWWSPPESDRWDAAANRYALGVILYELLAGEHPFGGAGLRHALREARQTEAAPLADPVARTLPPGLQSYLLRMIDPDPEARPQRAADIVASFEQALGAKTSSSLERRIPAVTRGVKQPKRSPPRVAAKRWSPALLTVGAIAASALALGYALDAPEPTRATSTVSIAAATPVDGAHTRAADCASCHPRQVAEWSQSVMGHAVKSPLFNALESLIQEQVGRDFDCPNGAGILRPAGRGACRDRQSGVVVTGSGGELWCVNCHAPGENLLPAMPAWQGVIGGDPRSRLPVRDLLGELPMEGIGCAFCHQVAGPVGRAGSGGYEGNPSWISFQTGTRFFSRPEDARGLFGIANSGYRLDPRQLLLGSAASRDTVKIGDLAVHARPDEAARAHLRSSEICGSCHDVRLFGSDVVGARKGEHFKRLRNAYSEWVAWSDRQRAARAPAGSCQDCHMSNWPGVCRPGPGNPDDLMDAACPEGTHFEARAIGDRPRGHAATSGPTGEISSHYFTGVDLPLARELAVEELDRPGLDDHGVPLSARARRDLLLRASVKMRLDGTRRGGRLAIPVTIENVGAGHRIPAGFSQEREIWLHLRVIDGGGRLIYEVGRVERDDEDLRDKIFLRVNTDPDRLDRLGRPQGLFGADVVDGPDAPRWSPPPSLGGRTFRGRGLVNFQNGFLRCVRCATTIAPDGSCEPRVGERHRAERYADGDYDLDTGECRSNLFGDHALFETYFPVGALDADRGVPKAPDAIIDTRSLAPGEPVTYTYELDVGRGPFRVEARLMFRSFPPFLVKAFAAYEEAQARAGKRPSGPLVTFDMLRRLERVELARASIVVP
jgi:eukaryotic-like serine/threonine-protein kinase